MATAKRCPKTGKFLPNPRRKQAKVKKVLPKAKGRRKGTQVLARKPRPKTRRRNKARPAFTVSPFKRNPQAVPMGQRDHLEANFVDKFTLAGVLDALAEICVDKEIHLESAWDDAIAATPWRQMARKLEAAAVQAQKRGI
jgi:hypothetical protein